MPKKAKARVIVDTNCWISFLIGHRLHRLVDLLSEETIQLIICDELLDEIRDVTSRPKFIKYFPTKEVNSLIEFLQLIGESIYPHQSVQLCRDESDNYLLALAIEANADYLVTGDLDLLVLDHVGDCKIVNVETFEQALQ
jgi:hypothetical protein